MVFTPRNWKSYQGNKTQGSHQASIKRKKRILEELSSEVGKDKTEKPQISGNQRRENVSRRTLVNVKRME